MEVEASAAAQQCGKCGSRRLTEFRTEICIHIPGKENWTAPAVFVFPELAICMDCGRVRAFLIREENLTELRGGVPGA